MKRKKDIDRLLRLTNRFPRVRLMVIGDLMMDQFIWGNVERISPEAPVPVVLVESESFMLGGAANVANNLRSLGARVSLCGIVGDDLTGEHLTRAIRETEIDAGGLYSHPRRSTIIKTRVIANNQQVVRFDREETDGLDPKCQDRLLDYIRRSVNDCQAVIISDYGKGIVGRRFMAEFKKIIAGRRIPVVVDPQVKHASLYKDLTVVTPNHHEAGAMLGKKLVTDEDIRWAGKTLLRRLKLKALLITRGEHGMTLFDREGTEIHIPTVAREVYDVTGAGDTVIAAFSLSIALGADLSDAATIANLAAGLVVGEVGTATLEIDRLREAVMDSRF